MAVISAPLDRGGVLRQDPPYPGECRDLSRTLPRKQSVTSLQIVGRYLVDRVSAKHYMRRRIAGTIEKANGFAFRASRRTERHGD
jgi:hypothetical protein